MPTIDLRDPATYAFYFAPLNPEDFPGHPQHVELSSSAASSAAESSPAHIRHDTAARSANENRPNGETATPTPPPSVQSAARS